MTLTVLYITGWCRNGSTVLGNVLAEAPGVFHTGELRFLWLNGVVGEGSNRRCGCGTPIVDCPLWSKVLEAGRPADRTLVRHAADVVAWQSSHRTRHTWQVLREPPDTGWPGTLAATYHAIAETTGAQVIVDSSKFASDAALLYGLDGIQARTLHLVRDPRGAAWSWLRPKDYTGERGIVDSTAHWLGFNLAAEEVSRAHPETATRMRYEDLVRDPRSSVGEVLRLIGRPDLANPVAPDGTAELNGNHTVTGNPNRFRRGRVELTEDRAWRRQMPAGPRAATTLMAMPLLGRYGYERRP